MTKSYRIKKDGKRWVSMCGNQVIGFHSTKTAAKKKVISKIRKELSK